MISSETQDEETRPMAIKASNVRVGNDRDGAADGWFVRLGDACEGV